jgi:hypothetical protein
MTHNSSLSECEVHAAHGFRTDRRRWCRLAPTLPAVILLASLAPPAAGAAYAETATKSQAEVRSEMTDYNAGYNGEGDFVSKMNLWLADDNAQRNFCKSIGGTFTFYSGGATCHAN